MELKSALPSRPCLYVKSWTSRSTGRRSKALKHELASSTHLDWTALECSKAGASLISARTDNGLGIVQSPTATSPVSLFLRFPNAR
ncbi:unnamed protein product [Rhizoctonia solani]|uniref:Uncharacterized protein n=1 Tax=Rhizoctonia solani TaxID=456999 RepID=A0A8H3E277_9AGAM|nr:unnamed protein product [Rhizoctonia solani]